MRETKDYNYLFAWKKFRIGKIISSIGLLLLLIVTFGCGSKQDGEPILGTGDGEKTLYGTPNKIKVAQIPKNETTFKFVIISDTHVDATTTCNKSSWWTFTNCDAGDCFGWNDSLYMKHNRTMVDQINDQCRSPECLGIVHMGDMVEQGPGKDEYATQQVIAFRQFYENDYPGRHKGVIRSTHGICSGCGDGETAYSEGHKITVPLFPTIGNHDAPKDWQKPADYISERVKGAAGIAAWYGEGSYIWRWGQYYFIQLGLWAGSYGYESNTDVNYDKLNWLKGWLRSNVGNSNMGVLIFQHYPFGTGERWWTESMKNKELNILCRRERDSDPCNPYNIIGIFAGHDHLLSSDVISAGRDSQGNAVNFNQYRIPDVGKNNNKQYGFSVVWLKETMMTIKTRNNNTGQSTPYEKPISTGTGDPNSFRYAIGWDVQTNGTPTNNSWSGVINFLDQPFGGGVPSGGGAAIANIDANPGVDLVLMGVDSTKGRGGNRFYYKVGRNLNTDGKTNDWSNAKWAPPNLGVSSAGGGAAIADLNRNGIPDLLFMVVDDPDGNNNFRYVIGWDIDANGDPASWSPLKYAPTSLDVGVYSQGGGASIADIDGNGVADLLFMVIDNPSGRNGFRYVIGWNVKDNGDPAQWSNMIYAPNSFDIGVETAGGGASIADIDGNGVPDLVLMAIANNTGMNDFRYVIGWNLQSSGAHQGAPASWSSLMRAPTSLDIGAENAGGGAAIADINKNGRLDLLFMAIDNP